MKYTGEINITDELTLNSPTAEVSDVRYSWKGDNKIYFEILFQEPNSKIKHSRTFEITNEGGGYLSGQDIWNKLIEHPGLAGFNTEENTTWIQKFINFFK